MKKLILLVVLILTVLGAICYYDDPKYYHKTFKKMAKKNMKKCDYICDLFNF